MAVVTINTGKFRITQQQIGLSNTWSVIYKSKYLSNTNNHFKKLQKNQITTILSRNKYLQEVLCSIVLVIQ
jgi:hypothetical protein